MLDGGITGFLSVMKTLRGMRFAHFVPGHGRTDKPWPAAMDPQQRYFDVIRAETRVAIRRKLSLMEALDLVGLSEAENWPNFDDYHRRNVTSAYTELEWEE